MVYMREYAGNINDFSGGLATKKREINDLPFKYSPDCMDTYADEDGALHSRPGATLLNTAQVGAGTKEGNGLFDFEGTLIGSFGTTYYKMDELDGTWDSLQTGMKDDIIQCENYLGNLIVCNWSNDYAKTMQSGDTVMTNISTTSSAGRGKHPKVYKDHLLMCGVPGYPYTFFYSEVNDFDDFENGGTWNIQTHDGDELIGWGELDDRLYAFKQWSTHQVTFRGGSPYWSVRQITTGVGSRSPLSIQNVTKKDGSEVIIFLGSDKRLREFDGFDSRAVSDNFEETNGVAPISLGTLNDGAMKYAHAIIDPAKHWYILFVGNGGSSDMSHGLIYNYYTGACWPFAGQRYKSSASVIESGGRRRTITSDYEGHSYRWGYGDYDQAPLSNVEQGVDGSLIDIGTHVLTPGGFDSGTHDGGDDAAYAEDASENFTTGGVVAGDYLLNKSDQSFGIVTSIANGAGTNARLMATGGFSGGTDNDFDDDDVFDVYKAVYLADNDSIYIGSVVPFNMVVVNMQQAGSSDVGLVASYSTSTAGVYTALTATDGTSGFTGSGVIEYDLPSAWAKADDDDGNNAFSDTTDLYYLKLQRTANALVTTPKISSIEVGNRIAAYHTTPKMILDPATLSEVFEVTSAVRSLSNKTVSFQFRPDYIDSWSAAETIKMSTINGEYYLGVDTTLGTATLGAAREIRENTISVDSQLQNVQFKTSSKHYGIPWSLYSYNLIGRKVAKARQV